MILWNYMVTPPWSSNECKIGFVCCSPLNPILEVAIYFYSGTHLESTSWKNSATFVLARVQPNDLKFFLLFIDAKCVDA